MDFVELGDAQVAGLPEIVARPFYEALKDAVGSETEQEARPQIMS